MGAIPDADLAVAIAANEVVLALGQADLDTIGFASPSAIFCGPWIAGTINAYGHASGLGVLRPPVAFHLEYRKKADLPASRRRGYVLGRKYGMHDASRSNPHSLL